MATTTTAPILSPSQYVNYELFLIYATKFPDFPKGFVPPSFTESNYVAPNKGTALEAVILTFLILSFIIVVIRLGLRFTRRGRIGRAIFSADDYFLVISLAANAAYVGVVVHTVVDACLGKHVYDCQITLALKSFKNAFVGLFFYFLCATAIKLSLLFFLLRLPIVTGKRTRATIWGTIIFVAITWVVSTINFALQCHPYEAAWNPLARLSADTKCENLWKLVFAYAAVYTIADIWLVILPFVIFWRSVAPLPQRLGVLFVTLWGVIATVSTILKTILIPHSYDGYDVTWNFVNLIYTTQLEMAFGIIAAALPGLAVLFDKITPSLVPHVNGGAQSKRRSLFGRARSRPDEKVEEAHTPPSPENERFSNEKQTPQIELSLPRHDDADSMNRQVIRASEDDDGFSMPIEGHRRY